MANASRFQHATLDQSDSDSFDIPFILGAV